MKHLYLSKSIYQRLVKQSKRALLMMFGAASTLVYGQQSYTFTNASATGSVGPTQIQVNNAYASTNLANSVSVSPIGIQNWTVPISGGYRIEAYGAQGGGANGGLGAYMAGDFTLTAGDVLSILVGQQGETVSSDRNTGGGGGSFVIENINNNILVIAGGGGGSANAFATAHGTTSANGQTGYVGVSTAEGAGGVAGMGGGGASCRGAGGAGWLGIGAPGACGAPAGLSGATFTNGGTGGATTNGAAGGFGGGGSSDGTNNAWTYSGGGGGYSGGGGASEGALNARGGGGGSFNSGVNQTNTSGINSGHGKVIITELCNIKIFASGTNSTNPAICSGNSLTLTTTAVSNILWNTTATTTSIVVSPATNTVYSVVGTSTDNCTAAAQISVNVDSSMPVISISNPSTSLCFGQTATLIASGAHTYTWTNSVTNGQPFVPSNTATYVVTGANGCGTATAMTSITVAPIPVNITANPTLVCEGYAATLTAVSSAPNYTWSNNMNTSVIVVQPTATTVYSVEVSDGPCSGTATLSLPTKPTPIVSASGSTNTVCEGEPLSMSASGAQSYVWSPGGATGANISVTPTASTLYQVSGTNSVGCTAYANWLVLVEPAPNVTAGSNKPLVCSGDEAVLTANGAVSYVWTGGPSTAAYSVNPTSQTIYTVVGTGTNSCIKSATVNVNVFSPTVAITTASTSICEGNSTILNASTANSYTWNGTPGLSFLAISPSVTSTYTLAVTIFSSGVNCKAEETITITVNPNPTVTIVATKTVLCRNDQQAVLTGSGAVTYTWSNASQTPTINASNQVSTTYYVDGIDANGCPGTSTSLFIKVDGCTGVADYKASANTFDVYPNPNNGTFSVRASQETLLNLMNELGQIVKELHLNESNNYQVNVSDLPAGIYFVTGNDQRFKIVVTE